MDIIMEDAGPPPNFSTSDTDVDMGEADPLPAGFVRRNPNVINIENDDGNDSDSTLLGDEYIEQVKPSASEARRLRRQARAQTVNFRELQTYTRGGRAVQVGRTMQGQNGNLLRVISIKQDWESGFITIESIEDNHRTLQTYSYEGRTLKPGKTVEMADKAFLRIKTILEDRRTGEIFLQGLRFERNSSLKGLLELKVNEVTMIVKHDPNDARDIPEQSIQTINLAAVVRIRELIMTNYQFPTLSFRETDSASLASSMEYMSAYCRLTCRWKFLKISKNEGVLSRLTDLEADSGCMIPQDQLRRDFRGRTTKGGASSGWLDEEIAFEQEERMRSRDIELLRFRRPDPNMNAAANRHHQRRYMFGDAFCGGGGVSRGAYKAGLRVEWGFDHDPDAIATYRLNFPHAKCEGISAYEFAMSINANYKVDILHLSPPCQRFSPLHTRPFINDEQYEATFLATEMLLRKTTPRIVTLEETFGLTRTVDNLEWFNAMIQMFTKLGFSVRWKVFNLLDFGLPQPRKRLFIYASCPGETLPDFPEPTHCKAEEVPRRRLSRFSTVKDAIDRIPRDFPDHSTQLGTKFNKSPYSGDLPVRKTICCTGQSINYHPSGKRCFTTRELACLQGFPFEHRFGPRGARKQIGNAVPPIVMKVFFEQVIRSLREADGLGP